MEVITLKYENKVVLTFVGAKVCTINRVRHISHIREFGTVFFKEGGYINTSSLFKYPTYLVETGVGLLECLAEDYVRSDKELLAIENLKLKYKENERMRFSSSGMSIGILSPSSSIGVTSVQKDAGHLFINTENEKLYKKDWELPYWLDDVNKKETTEMIEKKLEVLGVNIFTATPSKLIDIIKDLSKKADELEDVPVQSTYVDAKIKEIEKAIKKVVKELDSRAS